MFRNFTFTKRYLLALFLIALLALLAYVNLNRLINSQADDGKWIYISDHQRLLTQQIALYAIYYQTKELHVKINELQKAHVLLVLNAKTNEKLKQIYFHKPINLDKKIRDFLFHAHRFYENKDGQSLNYILKNSKLLLSDLEKVVNVYLKQSNSNTKILGKFEFYILILTLLTLIFEALFIFMPANRSINKKTKELLAGQDYLNALIQSSTDAIISLDQEATIRTFNKEAEHIFRISFKKIAIGNSLNLLFPDKYENASNKKILNFLTHLSKKNKTIAITLKRTNNEKFPAHISFGKSNENEDIAVLLHVKDISKEKLRDDIVAHQGKFAALGEMIAIIAHQWRQPLAQLNFNHMYLKNKIEDENLQKEFIKNEEIISFMSETITNFEEFYKKTKDSSFDVEISINQALNIVQASLKSNKITLNKQILPTNTIFGSTNNLSQVILSILQNAIGITKSKKAKNPIININLSQNKKNIILTIQDNLGGIRVSPIDDIFKPLVSKKTSPSTGMGLYMSKLIIEEKFHGSIKAENKNNGANFTIILPC